MISDSDSDEAPVEAKPSKNFIVRFLSSKTKSAKQGTFFGVFSPVL